MHIHILGICGTFMGGLALLARDLGYQVSGSDENVYPPMSTQLEAAGIDIKTGYLAEHLNFAPDLVVVGNAMTRGKPAVEYMLNQGLPYTSGPQWLAEHVLPGKHVLAVAGTHGKTTTSSMLAWILEYAGLNPGFLIGGVADDLGVSARLGAGKYFVIEADEYDTAFFDKRSKFVHYRPRTTVLNNLEFDHADIFSNLAAIQRQFHHLVRIVPGEGRIISRSNDANLEQVLEMGCWTLIERFGAHEWQAINAEPDGTAFDVQYRGETQGRLIWGQLGEHNKNNALAAIASANHVGVSVAESIQALANFQGVKRRMEVRGTVSGVKVYDDFAHHPTAIATTLAGLRAKVGKARIIAVLEPRSNTMRMGMFKQALVDSLKLADEVVMYLPPTLDWQPENMGVNTRLVRSIEETVQAAVSNARSGDHILVMSNGGFGGIHSLLLDSLSSAKAEIP